MQEMPPMNLPSRIVAAGIFSPRSKAYNAERTRLIAGIESRRADELKSASWFGRIRVRITIEREAQAALDKTFPPGALYAIPQNLSLHNQSEDPTP
jgi:hypothetical protein